MLVDYLFGHAAVGLGALFGFLQIEQVGSQQGLGNHAEIGDLDSAFAFA